MSPPLGSLPGCAEQGAGAGEGARVPRTLCLWWGCSKEVALTTLCPPQLICRKSHLEVDVGGAPWLKPAGPTTSENVPGKLQGACGPRPRPLEQRADLSTLKCAQGLVCAPAHSSCLLRTFSRGCPFMVTSLHSPESTKLITQGQVSTGNGCHLPTQPKRPRERQRATRWGLVRTGEVSGPVFSANRSTQGPPKVHPTQTASNEHPKLFPGPREFRRGGPPSTPGPLSLTLGIKAKWLWCYYRKRLLNLPKPAAGRPGRKGTE